MNISTSIIKPCKSFTDQHRGSNQKEAKGKRKKNKLNPLFMRALSLLVNYTYNQQIKADK